MALQLVRLRFREIPNNGKFLGRIPGREKRVKLVKTWGDRAKLQDNSSTMLYEFKPDEMVFAWRWRS